MNKQQLKEELKDVKILYFVSKNSTYTNWNVYYVKDNRLHQIWIDTDEKDIPTFWIPEHITKKGNRIGGYFQNTVLGSSRVFEIALSLSRWLYNGEHEFDYVIL